MKTDIIIKQFQDEVGKIDSHYLTVCTDDKCKRTIIGDVFERYLEKIKTDLLKIADDGEYEDMRREIEKYFKQ